MNRAFEKELVDYLYKNFKVSAVGLFASSLVIFALLHNYVSQKWLLLFWLAAMLVILAIRYHFLLLYQKEPEAYTTQMWKRLFFASLTASTIIWSAAPLFIIEIDDPIPIALIMAVYTGVAAGGILSLSAYIRASIFFLTLPLATFTAVLLLKENVQLLELAFLLVFYYFFMLFVSKRLHQQYLQVLVSNKKYQLEKQIAIEAQERLKALFDGSPIGIFFYDTHHRLIDANTNFYNLLGLSDETDHLPKEVKDLLQTDQKNEFTLETKDKTLKILTSAVTHNGTTLGWVGTLSDITQERQLLKKTQHQATYDHLTQIPNRSKLFEHIQREIEKVGNKNRSFAVLFIDLDNFKNINDSLGHHVGDKILIEISKRLKQTLRKSDFLARLGGDEFVVVLPNLGPDPHKSAKIIELITQKLQNTISKPIIIENNTLYLTSSIGVACVQDANVDAYDIVKYADIAMYQAKRSGKNMTKFYQKEMDDLIKRRVEVENFQKSAIAKRKLTLAYQPIVDITQNRIVALEALLRITDARFRNLPIHEFISIAEESGTIVHIGTWIFDKALEEFAIISKTFGLQKIALNVSIKQFQEPDFVDTIVKIAKERDVPFEQIELEITESIFINDKDRAKTVMQELRGLGFSISIDDFGTGYSSLSYLKHLPITTLKIDRSFVGGIVDNEEDRDLVETILTIAKKFGLQTVAEGIETKEQLQLMRQLGCDLYQGYIKSKPLQYQKLITLLQEENKC